MANSSTTDSFFEEQTEKSAIKSAIVSNFFKIYLRIISNRFKNEDIYYIDLFSGPGRYKNNKKSTPLYIMDAVESFNGNGILSRFHFVFNEYDKKLFLDLEKNIKAHDIYPKLAYVPIVTNKTADQVDLSDYIKGNTPVFSFVDPFGYKSTSAKQIWDLVHGVGSDCIFFFNANRIIVDFNKDNKERDFKDLFGKRYSQLCDEIANSDSHHKKMKAVLNAFSKNLIDIVKEETYNYQLYILPFGFSFDDREKESHYLLFITKNHKAVCEMKSVMSKVATSISEMYSYDSKVVSQIPLFTMENDAYTIFKETIKRFKGELIGKKWTLVTLLKTVDDISMRKAYKVSPFTSKDTRKFLRELYNEGFITSDKPFSGREVFSDKREFYIKEV